MIKKILPFLVLSICLVIAYQIRQTQPAASYGKISKPSPLLVEVQEIRAQDYSVMVSSYGLLNANVRTNLLPLVTGRVESVSPDFVAGGFIREGQTLLKIDPIQYEVNLQVARSDLAQAELALAEEEARYSQARRDWDAQQARNPARKQAATDLVLRQPQLKAAQAQLATAQAKLKLAETDLERTNVTAPYDGRIIETFVNIGSVVNNATTLAELYADKSLELRLPISSRDLAFVDLPDTASQGSQSGKASSKVRLENSLVSPVQYWQGVVTGTQAVVDADNQQVYALAEILAPEDDIAPELIKALKVGQYLQAQIQGKTLNGAILIPNSAIYQGSYVYLAEASDEETILRRQTVSIGWRNEEHSLIVKGLSEGQRLVTTVLGQVSSGTRIQLFSAESGDGEAQP